MSRPYRTVITQFANKLKEEINRSSEIVCQQEVISAVGWTELEARLYLGIQNIKEKNKEYADYLASLSEGEKNKEEKLHEKSLNKGNNLLSILMSAKEL